MFSGSPLYPQVKNAEFFKENATDSPRETPMTTGTTYAGGGVEPLP